jgi:hypothetical protein
LGNQTAERTFWALTGLHGLRERDVALVTRATAGYRFIRAMHPFGAHERALMRIAIADLTPADSFIVEAAATCAADLPFEGDDGEWDRASGQDRCRAVWISAILRLSTSLDAVHSSSVGGIHAAWSPEILHIEIDGVALSDHDLERIRGRRAALEAVSGRRVLVTSAARRRGAA